MTAKLRRWYLRWDGRPGTTIPIFTLVVKVLTQIWIDEEQDGLRTAVQIASQDEGETRVLFEPEAALAEG